MLGRVSAGVASCRGGWRAGWNRVWGLGGSGAQLPLGGVLYCLNLRSLAVVVSSSMSEAGRSFLDSCTGPGVRALCVVLCRPPRRRLWISERIAGWWLLLRL